MGFELRPYQIELKAACRQAIREGNRSVLLQCPTGGGKTVTAADIMAAVEGAGMRNLFLLPRRELVYQSFEKMVGFHVYPGIIMAGERADVSKRTQLASVDTLYARAVRTDRMEMPEADYVLVDEAHLFAAETRAAIIQAYPKAKIIGLTATPARADGKPLGKLFDTLVLSWPTQRMVDEGYLVDQRYFAPSEPDLHGIRMHKDGDYQEKALGVVMDKPKLIGDIVDNWFRIASDRRTVVFCVTCSHGRHVCEEFVRRGVKAEYVDGDTPKNERKQIFKNIERGTTQVLVNVFVATFGLDIPILSCCVIARPTRNLVLYHQMGGRVLRPVYAPGLPISTKEERLLAIACSAKPDCLIIDHAGIWHKHGKLPDHVPWALEFEGTISDAKRKEEQEAKAPKEMRCEECNTVFSGSRFCPSCGHQLIVPGKPVPVHQAELVEVGGNDANRKAADVDKIEFLSQAMGYAQEKGFHPRFADNKYLEKFGKSPPAEIRDVARPNGRRNVINGWLAHMGMRRKFRR